MQFDFISIILIIGMAQCLFLMIAIVVDKQRFKVANLLLFILLFTFLWYQFEFLLIREKLDSRIPFLYSTRYGSWLLVGPLLLLYNRAILIEGFRLGLKNFWHFLPFVLFTILIPLFIGDIVTNRAINYGMLTVFDSFNQELITWKHFLYGGVFIFQFVHATVYLFQAFRETQQIESIAKQQRSSISMNRVNTLKYL